MTTNLAVILLIASSNVGSCTDVPEPVRAVRTDQGWVRGMTGHCQKICCSQGQIVLDCNHLLLDNVFDAASSTELSPRTEILTHLLVPKSNVGTGIECRYLKLMMTPVPNSQNRSQRFLIPSHHYFTCLWQEMWCFY